MSAKMTKRKCAEKGCTEDHTLMSKFCLGHIHSNSEDGTLTLREIAQPETQKTSVKAAKKKKVTPKRKSTPSKAKAKKGKGKGSGTPAQLKAAKAAKAFPQIHWVDEIKEFKKSKDRELSIELGSPGSAQVTRVRILKASYAKGLRITTVGASINFFKKGR